MALRKVAVEGTWWAQRRDGSWLRWDAGRNDWRPEGRPPAGRPAEPPAQPVFSFPVSSGVHGWDLPPALGLLGAWLRTYLSLALPSALVLMLGAPILHLFSLFLLFLTGPIDVAGFLRDVSVFLAIYLAFLSAAFVVMRRALGAGWAGLVGFAAALGLALAGSVVASRAAGFAADRSMLWELNVWSMVTVAAVGAFALLERGLRRLTGRLTLLRPRVFAR
jgi:hypothetical protein